MLIDRFLNNAVEVDVMPCVMAVMSILAASWNISKKRAFILATLHCSLPPQHLSDEILEALKQQTRDLAFALNVVGLMNIQFAIRENKIYCWK